MTIYITELVAGLLIIARLFIWGRVILEILRNEYDD